MSIAEQLVEEISSQFEAANDDSDHAETIIQDSLEVRVELGLVEYIGEITADHELLPAQVSDGGQGQLAFFSDQSFAVLMFTENEDGLNLYLGNGAVGDYEEFEASFVSQCVGRVMSFTPHHNSKRVH